MNKPHQPSLALFNQGDVFFQNLFDDLAVAKHHINIEVYKFALRSIGAELAQLLIKKAEEGVKVRILVDGIGSFAWGGSWVTKMEKAGIQTKLYHPIPWQWWQLSRSAAQLPWALKFFYLFTKINTRNHRKIINIDDKIIYFGSINFCPNHVSVGKKGKNWRDTCVRITDSDIHPIQFAFEKSWGSLAWRQRCQHYFSVIDPQCPFQLNDTLRRRRYYFRNLLRKIRKSQEKIWITNAYFTPNHALLRALIKAATKNKIDIRILIPKNSDIPFITTATRYFYQTLIKANVRIFEYLPSMLHSKTIIIDNWAMIGTSNLNHRSLLHDLEIDYTITNPSIIKDLEAQFIDDQQQSDYISAITMHRMPWYSRLFGRLILLFKFIF